MKNWKEQYWKRGEQCIPWFFFFLRSAFLERQTPSVFSSDTEEQRKHTASPS